MTLTLETARRILDAALAEAVKRGMKPMAFAVLDARGSLVAFAAQDGVSLMRGDVARAKGYGAIALGMGSRAIFKRAQEQAYFIASVSTLARGGIIPLPGGVLVRDGGGVLLGAVGISGDTAGNDEVCAVAGIVAAGLVADAG